MGAYHTSVYPSQNVQTGEQDHSELHILII